MVQALRLFRLQAACIALALLFGCARAPLIDPALALRHVEPAKLGVAMSAPADLPMAPLVAAVQSEIEFLEKQPAPREFVFGRERFSQTEYVQALKDFLALAQKAPDEAALRQAAAREFDFYAVYGQKDWGDVFMTSYYEPWIHGSRKPKGQFTQPLYRTPPDLLALDLAGFDPKFKDERKLRARVIEAGGLQKLVPYYTREEIDAKSALQGHKLEICYVDPVDAFFLQVQGSGVIDLGHGHTIHVNYAERNGQPYEAVGKFLKDKLPGGQITLQTIEAALRQMPREEMQKYLDENPSYVFFKTTDESSLTYLGVPATDGRTIATDPHFFPKGALALLTFPKPVFAKSDDTMPSGTEQVSRFVLDQDIGGAITGGGRLDLFWGRGDEAKRYAGAMKTHGMLYYLAPKKKPAATP